MDLGTIRSQTRTYLDLSTSEVSDALLDMFIQDGYDQIIRKDNRWPWLQTQWQLVTTPGTNAYPLSGLDPLPRDLLSILRPDSLNLTWLGHDEAELRFSRPSGSTGQPVAYSTWAENLYLWPKPNAAELLLLRGLRNPIDWLTGDAGATPDMPEQFHGLLVRWAIACCYEHQDDTEMTQANVQHFMKQLQTLHKDVMRAAEPQPIVMGSKPATRSMLMNGPFFPFEV